MHYVKINIIILIVNHNYLTMFVNNFVYLGIITRTAVKQKKSPAGARLVSMVGMLPMVS